MKIIYLSFLLPVILLIQGCSTESEEVISREGKDSKTVYYLESLFGDVNIQSSVVIDPGFCLPCSKITPARYIKRWIQIDVDYRTADLKNVITNDTAWLEDVIMKYDVLLPNVEGKPRVVLSGEVTYWALPMDGKMHHAQVFIHPQFLRRYVHYLKLKKSKMKEMHLLLTFVLDDLPVGYGVFKPNPGATIEKEEAEIGKALSLPVTIHVKDAIFSRDETPWGIINLDYYELIKRKN